MTKRDYSDESLDSLESSLSVENDLRSNNNNDYELDAIPAEENDRIEPEET